MLSLSRRAHDPEMMDDFSIVDERLLRALDNLRLVNRWLGGYAATLQVLAPFLREHRSRPVRLLDLATGVADLPEHLVRWADRRGFDLEVVGVDANPETVAYARRKLDERLPRSLRNRIRLEVGDALSLSYASGSFDVVHSALFLHHLRHEEGVRLVREMNRVGRHGLIINDLHRHVLAYYAIKVIALVLPVSAMFRHDGPLSVRRGFRRDELRAIAKEAGLSTYVIRWHWAFRWTLSSLHRPTASA